MSISNYGSEDRIQNPAMFAAPRMIKFSTGMWEQDALELFLGLYDQRGARHGKFSRGAEPDFKFVILGDSAFVEFGQTTPLNDKSYFHLHNSGVNNKVVDRFFR